MQKCSIWPSSAATRSFKLHLVVCSLKGLPQRDVSDSPNNYLKVQIEWKGPTRKTKYLSHASAAKNCTSKKCPQQPDGIVSWNEEFDHDCKLKLKDSHRFKSWVINLEVHKSGQESSSKASILAKVKVNIAKFASMDKNSKGTMSLPVKCVTDGSTADAMLVVEFNLYEAQTKRSNSTVYPLSQALLLPSFSSCIRPPQQTHSARSQNPEALEEVDETKEYEISHTQANDSSASDSATDEEPELSYRNLAATSQQHDGLISSNLQFSIKEVNGDEIRTDPLKRQPSLVRLLSWNKRKISFRSLHHPKDTPLLNKANNENGGDDIDNDRRYQFVPQQKTRLQDEDLSSDRFEIGAWEQKKLVSRDGNLELETEIFLASIDQRSEKAAGGSACTALVAVIADWLHQNPRVLPLRCQLDKLIREGSSEWRNLCENETLKEKFPDQHFDLETVLQEKVRPLSVISEKSFVGFFILENMSEHFEFLHGAMSFDNIWEKLQSNEATFEECIYIVSWNDHFFLLKVEPDAIYIIDTLGERLSEGCTKAYILKFNKESKLYTVPPQPKTQLESENAETSSNSAEVGKHDKDSREIVSEGKDSCKEFIKGFLAALPLRELQADIARGRIREAPLHHRLQIEFHYTVPCTELQPNTHTEV